MTRKLLKILRKIGVALIGFPIVIIGLILIPLPGPGILITLVGLFILALEFEWAMRHKLRLRAQLDKIIAKSKQKNK